MISEFVNRIIEYFDTEAIPKKYGYNLKYMDLEKILQEYDELVTKECKDEFYNSGYDAGWDDGREEGLKEGYENCVDEMDNDSDDID